MLDRLSDDYRQNISQGEFQVRKDRLTGGIRIRLNGDECVVSPLVGVEIAAAILKMAGVAVRFDNPAQVIVLPGNGNGGLR